MSLLPGFPLDWPLDSNMIRRNAEMNSFGMVRCYPDGRPKPHQGWDLYAPEGTPIYAVADGQILITRDGGDYGKLIVLSISGTALYAAYAHLSVMFVSPGERVVVGELLGKTGCTGNAAGMKGDDQHLHFEVRTDPLPGLGLIGRKSPLDLYGVYPLRTAATRALRVADRA